MSMFEELKAWADKWNVAYTTEDDHVYDTIVFNGPNYFNAAFVYNRDTGEYEWLGGD